MHIVVEVPTLEKRENHPQMLLVNRELLFLHTEEKVVCWLLAL